MPKDEMGSRRARARPPKKEETKSKWKRRMIQLIAIVVILLMTLSSLFVLFTI
jgi:uncharacterized protein YpmS